MAFLNKQMIANSNLLHRLHQTNDKKKTLFIQAGKCTHFHSGLQMLLLNEGDVSGAAAEKGFVGPQQVWCRGLQTQCQREAAVLSQVKRNAEWQESADAVKAFRRRRGRCFLSHAAGGGRAVWLLPSSPSAAPSRGVTKTKANYVWQTALFCSAFMAS